MADKKDILRETDDDARSLATKLVRQARYAAIAVLDPETGDPMASRVLTGTDVDGTLVILISALAPHMAALLADPRASVLFGEVGKGDPLAHARITLKVEAARVERESRQGQRIRQRFIAKHPKAKLYVDFPDFAFFRLSPQSASLNGGFGRAYAITAEDLLISSPALEGLAAIEESAVNHMNTDHRDAADIMAKAFTKSTKIGWIVIGIDAAGIEISHGDELLRFNFIHQINDVDELRPVLSKLLNDARKICG